MYITLLHYFVSDMSLYSLTEVAAILKMNKANLHRLVNKLKIHQVRYRSPLANNQMVNGIDDEGLKRLKEYRAFGPSHDIATKFDSCFYVVQPCPDLSPLRVKMGFSDNIDQRLCQYRTICPTAKVLRTWECKREWEKAVIAQAVKKTYRRIGEEVFDVDDLNELLTRIDNIFSLYEA